MENKNSAEAILYQIEAFFLLQEIDHLAETNQNLIAPVLNKIYENRKNITWKEVFPILKLKTVFIMLFLPISCISTLSDEELNSLGLNLNVDYIKKYGICEKNSNKSHLSLSTILRTTRNAIAHYVEPSKSSNNSYKPIQITENTIIFKSDGRTIEFNNQQGIIEFIKDIINAAKAQCRKIMENINE